MINHRPWALLAAFMLTPLSAAQAGEALRPNIVVILADDLGIGDVQCYNPQTGKIRTPNIDRLAAQGLRFTDAHSSASICTPSRYALLTGRYPWRTRLRNGYFDPAERPLIAPDRTTIASLLKENGYRTAAIGKWHLGWDWPIAAEQKAAFYAKQEGPSLIPPHAQRAAWQQVFGQRLGGGPTSRGFERYFGTDVPNFPPYCFIEDDRTVGVPSQFLPAELLRNRQASVQGPAVPGWSLEQILPTLRDRAIGFIEESAKGQKPFFLYLPLTSPHVPLAVSAEWQGRSGISPYADWVMQTDDVIGCVLLALEKTRAAAQTLVIFASDNGFFRGAGLEELIQKGHFPSGPYAGYKRDIGEGGHREPFVVRWPGVVQASTRCDQLVQEVDLMATFADILGLKLPENAGEDSVSLLPLFRGHDRPVRNTAINSSITGLLSIRKGKWKLILGAGSGGERLPEEIEGRMHLKPEENFVRPGQNPGGVVLSLQLYDLDADPGETKNLLTDHAALAKELEALVQKQVNDGRSTPGLAQKNDGDVDWSKFMRNPGSAMR